MIQDSNHKIQIDADNSRFNVTDGTRDRVTMGKINATQFGISGSDSDGTILFKFGEAGNVIAGWEISSSRLGSPSLFRLLYLFPRSYFR